jgi:hypothetical protein
MSESYRKRKQKIIEKYCAKNYVTIHKFKKMQIKKLIK